MNTLEKIKLFTIKHHFHTNDFNGPVIGTEKLINYVDSLEEISLDKKRLKKTFNIVYSDFVKLKRRNDYHNFFRYLGALEIIYRILTDKMFDYEFPYRTVNYKPWYGLGFITKTRSESYVEMMDRILYDYYIKEILN